MAWILKDHGYGLSARAAKQEGKFQSSELLKRNELMANLSLNLCFFDLFYIGTSLYCISTR